MHPVRRKRVCPGRRRRPDLQFLPGVTVAPRAWSWPRRRTSLGSPANQITRDHDPLDLRRAVDHLEHLGERHEARERVVVEPSVRAEGLAALDRGPKRRVGTEPLGMSDRDGPPSEPSRSAAMPWPGGTSRCASASWRSMSAIGRKSAEALRYGLPKLTPGWSAATTNRATSRCPGSSCVFATTRRASTSPPSVTHALVPLTGSPRKPPRPRGTTAPSLLRPERRKAR